MERQKAMEDFYRSLVFTPYSAIFDSLNEELSDGTMVPSPMDDEIVKHPSEAELSVRYSMELIERSKETVLKRRRKERRVAATLIAANILGIAGASAYSASQSGHWDDRIEPSSDRAWGKIGDSDRDGIPDAYEEFLSLNAGEQNLIIQVDYTEEGLSMNQTAEKYIIDLFRSNGINLTFVRGMKIDPAFMEFERFRELSDVFSKQPMYHMILTKEDIGEREGDRKAIGVAPRNRNYFAIESGWNWWIETGAILHEIGHCVGFTHDKNPENVMASHMTSEKKLNYTQEQWEYMKQHGLRNSMERSWLDGLFN